MVIIHNQWSDLGSKSLMKQQNIITDRYKILQETKN